MAQDRTGQDRLDAADQDKLEGNFIGIFQRKMRIANE